MIVNDYPAIAQRVEQLARERKVARFVIPDGVVILPASVVHQGMTIPDCQLCLVFHSTIARFTALMASSRDLDIVHLRLEAFVRDFRQIYTSASIVRSYEIQLSQDDAALFNAYMGRIT